MKFVELPKNLKIKISPIYILKGEDSFVINSAIKHISNACGNEISDFNKSTFDNENFTIAKFIESLSMLPIGAEKRFILIKNINKLSESDKIEIEKELSNLPDTTCLTIVYNDAWKFLKTGEVVDCGKMDFSMLSKYISLELSKSNKEISQEALRSFIELCSYDMTKISTEIKKITSFSDDKSIERNDILAIVNPDEEYQIFELTENLGRKNGEKVLKILCNFLEKKEPIQNLIGLITNHFRRVAHVSISGMSESELAPLLGVKEYAIVKAKEQAKYFSKVQLKTILHLLAEIDEMIKSGKMNAENAIYYLIFKILYC